MAGGSCARTAIGTCNAVMTIAPNERLEIFICSGWGLGLRQAFGRAKSDTAMRKTVENRDSGYLDGMRRDAVYINSDRARRCPMFGNGAEGLRAVDAPAARRSSIGGRRG